MSSKSIQRMKIPAAVLDQHIAIIGKTGSGKTYAAKGLVEGLLESGRQVCVIDPTAAWWGLRLSANGRASKFGVVLLGGTRGDIPLSPRCGEAAARLVTDQRASVVIDTSDLTVGEYTRWFIDFAQTIYRTLKQPLHLVIDEAHYFMPQGKVPDPQAGRMLHAGNRLMSGGRSRGIRGMLITQRPAKLHKDALTCADTLIVMRVIAPQDRKAVKEWIDGCGNEGEGKRVLDSLAGLPRGSGWIWYPEGGFLERWTFAKITTYDSSATPKHGATVSAKVKSIDLSSVRSAMEEHVRDAEANDPRELKRRIAELEKAVRSKTVDPEVIHRHIDSALHTLRHEQEDRDRKFRRAIDTYEKRMVSIVELAQKNGVFVPGEATAKSTGGQATSGTPRTLTLQAVGRLERRRESGIDGVPEIRGGCLRMIWVLADRHPVRFTESQWATLSKMKKTGGSWGTYKSRLNREGLLELDGRLWTASDKALEIYSDPRRAPQTPEELVVDWKQKLDSGPGRMLDAFVAAGGRLSRHDLAGAVNMNANGGSFGTYLSKLTANRLVCKTDSGFVLAEELMG